MQKVDIEALGISEDVKMTRIYLVVQTNFFGTNAESEDNLDELYSEEYINLKYFTTFNAISSYKKYLENLQLTEPDHSYNLTQLRNSFKHIYQVCFDNNLSSCKDYLELHKGLYPQYILDLKDGHICYYSLLSLDLCEKNIQLEKNTVEFVCKNFYNLLSSLRSRLVFSKKIKPLSINTITIFQDLGKQNLYAQAVR